MSCSPSLPPALSQPRLRPGGLAGLLGAVALLLTTTIGVSTPAYAAEATVGLGSAGSFAVLAGSAITNTGPSVISGDLGLSPGSSVSGFPPGLLTNGAPHVGDAVADRAQDDLTTAYDDAAGRATVTDVTGQNLGGRTLTSGVVEHTSAMELTGTLTLDAQGDPNAVFIFKAGSSLVTASSSTVSLINGASPCNVFWQVGSSATLGTDSRFVGTVMALTSATLGTRASVQGRVLARNGTVTLDENTISQPACAPTTPPASSGSPSTGPTPAGPTSTASASPKTTPKTNGKPSSKPSSKPSGGPSPTSPAGSPTSTSSGAPSGPDGGSGDDGSAQSRSQGGPVVPAGRPDTGLGPVEPMGSGWLALLVLTMASVMAAAVLSLRRLAGLR